MDRGHRPPARPRGALRVGADDTADRAGLRARFSRGGSFTYVRRQISPEQKQRIEEANLEGVGFILFIAACFWLGARNPVAQGIVPEHEGSLLVAFIVALQLVIYTYDGWSAVIYFSEEVKEPARNIPRAMFGGVIAVMAIYLVLNVAFLRVVPLATIAREKLPVAVVAHHLFGFDGDNITRILAIVALLSAVNSNVLMAPRVVFAMARDRLFWHGAAEVNRGGTPDVALLISSMIAAVFVMWGGFNQVVAVLAFFFVANYTLSFT